MRIRPTLQIAKSLHVKDTNHVLAVKKKIQTVSALKATERGQSDNMEVCMLQVWQKRNKPMVWIRSQTVLCKVNLTQAQLLIH